MKKLVLVFTLIIAISGATIAQQKIGTGIGNKAPDLIGKTPTGKTLKLSDTKGKLVLLDFWAGWCSPCRKENPNLVKTYNEYKDKKFKNGKSFTVFSVSLDRTADMWKKAIVDDKLTWPNHISDLQYWNSKFAIIYNIHQIPSNFLINEDGIIIARDLRGPRLEATLAKYVK